MKSTSDVLGFRPDWFTFCYLHVLDHHITALGLRVSNGDSIRSGYKKSSQRHAPLSSEVLLWLYLFKPSYPGLTLHRLHTHYTFLTAQGVLVVVLYFLMDTGGWAIFCSCHGATLLSSSVIELWTLPTALCRFSIT